MAQSARPEMKARVPSIGSTIHMSVVDAGISAVSSDSQPAPGHSAVSCWCSRSLTAMSASVTGDLSSPLVQCLNAPCAVLRARAPASRITASSGARSALVSLAGNGQTLDAQGGCVGAVAEFQIVGRRQRPEYLKQIACDGDLAHRISAFSVFDPEAGGAAAVIAGDHVGARADQVGDVESVGNIGDQRVRCQATRLE